MYYSKTLHVRPVAFRKARMILVTSKFSFLLVLFVLEPYFFFPQNYKTNRIVLGVAEHFDWGGAAQKQLFVLQKCPFAKKITGAPPPDPPSPPPRGVGSPQTPSSPQTSDLNGVSIWRLMPHPPPLSQNPANAPATYITL